MDQSSDNDGKSTPSGNAWDFRFNQIVSQKNGNISTVGQFRGLPLTQVIAVQLKVGKHKLHMACFNQQLIVLQVSQASTYGALRVVVASPHLLLQLNQPINKWGVGHQWLSKMATGHLRLTNGDFNHLQPMIRGWKKLLI